MLTTRVYYVDIALQNVELTAIFVCHYMPVQMPLLSGKSFTAARHGTHFLMIKSYTLKKSQISGKGYTRFRITWKSLKFMHTSPYYVHLKDRISFFACSVLNCAQEVAGTCNGGNPLAVYKFAHEFGLPEETCQVYFALKFDPCSCFINECW
jgi:hypothetical protein